MSKADEFERMFNECDSTFVPWMVEHRALIARALRLLDAVENPEKCPEFVHARIVAHQHDYSPKHTADRIISALREVIS